MELVKIVGALAWVVGVVMLFVVPVFGVAVLLVALLLSVWTTQKTRERRHQELLDTTTVRRHRDETSDDWYNQ